AYTHLRVWNGNQSSTVNLGEVPAPPERTAHPVTVTNDEGWSEELRPILGNGLDQRIVEFPLKADAGPAQDFLYFRDLSTGKIITNLRRTGEAGVAISTIRGAYTGTDMESLSEGARLYVSSTKVSDLGVAQKVLVTSNVKAPTAGTTPVWNPVHEFTYRIKEKGPVLPVLEPTIRLEGGRAAITARCGSGSVVEPCGLAAVPEKDGVGVRPALFAANGRLEEPR
ncbi:hypothetical protein, partial [Streptomyces sp. NRRL F-2664]|uniref:hypothetical protein n=1 Tax=Streptomyces sp. NRRL F-2664 TaxID=1463842 RepID=UPI00131D10B0